MKGMASPVSQRFVNLPLRTKLMAFFVAVLAFSSLAFMLVAYAVVSDEYRGQIEYSSELSFSQAQDFIQKTVWPLMYAADMVYFNRDIQDILIRNAWGWAEDGNLAQQYRDMLTLQDALQSAGNTTEILQIRLYVRG